MEVDLDAWVSAATAAAIEDGIPVSTRRTYAWALRSFARFCRTVGRRELPATPETLAEYVTALTVSGLSPASIELQIAAIRAAHQHGGFPHQPDTRKARLVLRGYAKRRAADGAANARQAPPVSTAALRAMLQAAGEHDAATNGSAADRDRLVLALGITLMARRSELAALNLGDVREVEDGLEVAIRASKTDQDAKGVIVPVPRGRHALTAPVRLLRAWRAHLPEPAAGRGSGAAVAGGRSARQPRRPAFRRRDLADRAPLCAAGRPAGPGVLLGAFAAGWRGHRVLPRRGRPEHHRPPWPVEGGPPAVLRYIRAADRWRDNPIHGLDL